MDAAYFRVHHFARQLASPFPLLAAIGAKTRSIEIGTGGSRGRCRHGRASVEVGQSNVAPAM
jgi:alkanesulfonate monooxygenase SsuD/methylene tetrahydromethanopterin reductase-like flavin-dependent oxidoreductase (luciferase family)